MRRHDGLRVVFLELGVGSNTPVIIKYPFYKYTFCHLFQHLAENDNNILELLSCENNEIFLRYFKDSLNELVRSQLHNQECRRQIQLPEGFLVNHISSSFVEIVLWWVKNGLKQSPEEMSECFMAVITPSIK